jgi:transposase
MKIITIGVDLAKTLFQIHGVDADGEVDVHKLLRRGQMLAYFAALPPCIVGMEACSSAHYWARELIKLGHDVRLMPPSYVKPYVKRGKTDAADAEAICEAVRRPTMRFVPVKTPEQQAVLMLHRSRALLMRQRTMNVNALRGHLAEFGIVASQGARGLWKLVERAFDGDAEGRVLPRAARIALGALVSQIRHTQAEIRKIEAELLAWHRTSEASRRLETIPGVGVITATAIAVTDTDPAHFTSSRQFAAWLGLTPKPHSSGGKERLGGVSKMGDISAHAPHGRRDRGHPYARGSSSASASWINRLLTKKPARLVSVALANKTARIAWVLLVRKENYRVPATVVAT